MKEKFKNLFSKKESYYEPDNNNFKNEKLSPEQELKKLRKENENLKKDMVASSIELFKTRRSIRKFSDRPVDWNILYDIAEGAMNAPCAGNVQNYKIILVEDKNMKSELGKLAFQQYWLSDAPAVMVVTRDNYHLCELYPNEGKTYAIQNTAAMIENILMIAHFYGLGACWVEAYDNEVLKEHLGIPGELTVDAIIPIGYPLENPSVTKDPMMQHMFFEKYGNKKR